MTAVNVKNRRPSRHRKTNRITVMGGEKSLHSGDKSEVVSIPQALYTTGSPTLMHPGTCSRFPGRNVLLLYKTHLSSPRSWHIACPAHSLPALSSQQSQSTLPAALTALGIVLRAYKHHISILALSYTPSSLYEIRSH